MPELAICNISDGLSVPIPILPSDLIWILVGFPVPAVSNKSWLFVPPDLIFGEAPEDARNASGKPDLTYNAKLFAYNLLVPPVWKSIWLSVNVIFVSASPLCWISCATLIDAGVFTASIIPLNVVIPATVSYTHLRAHET